MPGPSIAERASSLEAGGPDIRESVRATGPAPRQRGPRSGSASRLAAGAVSLGNAAGPAVTAGLPVAGAEAKTIAHIGLFLLCVAALNRRCSQAASPCSAESKLQL